VILELADEVLVYDISVHKAYCLNRTAALVWHACDGDHSVSEITASVAEQLKQPVDADLIWVALEGLRANSLLEPMDDLPARFSGISRRTLMKRIGLSSAVALPIIASVVAPSAVQALSCSQSCQCSGLLAPVSVCPPGFAECPTGCSTCVIPPGGCFNSGDGVIACNGTCSSAGGGSTCPPSTTGDCTCFGNFSVGQTCPGVQCPGGCSACRVTQTCIPQEVGPPACNGVCQQ
jgi:hypothetical protein